MSTVFSPPLVLSNLLTRKVRPYSGREGIRAIPSLLNWHTCFNISFEKGTNLKFMRIEKICALERLVEVRDEWNALVKFSSQNCVFLTNEWFCTWIDSFGASFQLYVLLFRDKNNHLFGAAPLMKAEGRVQFMASHEVTDYCDFVIERGREEDFFRIFAKRSISRSANLRIFFLSPRFVPSAMW